MSIFHRHNSHPAAPAPELPAAHNDLMMAAQRAGNIAIIGDESGLVSVQMNQLYEDVPYTQSNPMTELDPSTPYIMDPADIAALPGLAYPDLIPTDPQLTREHSVAAESQENRGFVVTNYPAKIPETAAYLAVARRNQKVARKTAKLEPPRAESLVEDTTIIRKS